VEAPNFSPGEVLGGSPGLLVRGSGFSNPRKRSENKKEGFSPGVCFSPRFDIPQPLRTANHVDKELVNAAIARKFGVKRGRQQFALPHQNGKTISFRHNLDTRANTGDARRADIDHLQRSSGQLGFHRLDGAIDLPAIGIPFHADIHHGQTLLRRLGDIAGQKDTTGTRAKSRLLLNKALQRFKQAVALEKLEESGRLPTGKDQAVQTLQLRRRADLDGICTSLDNSLSMGSKISLDGEHPDARTLQTLPAAGLQQFTLLEAGNRQTLHCAGHLLAHLG
jgi:hypothetical protein